MKRIYIAIISVCNEYGRYRTFDVDLHTSKKGYADDLRRRGYQVTEILTENTFNRLMTSWSLEKHGHKQAVLDFIADNHGDITATIDDLRMEMRAMF